MRKNKIKTALIVLLAEFVNAAVSDDFSQSESEERSFEINELFFTTDDDIRTDANRTRQNIARNASGLSNQFTSRQNHDWMKNNRRFNTYAEKSKMRWQPDDDLTLRAHNVKSVFEMYAKNVTDYIMEVSVLGQTVEFNDLVLIKMSAKETRRKVYEEEKNYVVKKTVLIVHGLNTVGFYENQALATYKYLLRMVTMYSKWLDRVHILFMPLANPDGASAIIRENKWSKNYSPQSACNGVALDRNFGTNNDPQNSCSVFYPGQQAFSEKESKLIRSIFESYGNEIHAYFNVRASSESPQVMKGEVLLYPFGHEKAMDVVTLEKYNMLKERILEVTSKTFQVMKFQCDSIHSWYNDDIQGTSVDFAVDEMKVPFAFEMLVQSYSAKEITVAALNLVWKNVLNVIGNTIL